MISDALSIMLAGATLASLSFGFWVGMQGGDAVRRVQRGPIPAVTTGVQFTLSVGVLFTYGMGL